MDLEDFELRRVRNYDSYWHVYYQGRRMDTSDGFNYWYETKFWAKRAIRRKIRNHGRHGRVRVDVIKMEPSWFDRLTRRVREP